MAKALKGGVALAAAGAVIGVGAPVSVASTVALHVKAPSKINRNKPFNVVASGTGSVKHNYLALFFSHKRCAGTYAAESSPGRATLDRSLFVGKTFKVTMLHQVVGGHAGTGFFCTYLYPKAPPHTSAWAFKKPEALNRHKITFT